MTLPADTDIATLHPTLQRLRRAWTEQRPPLVQRRADLKRLRVALADRLELMAAATADDFGHRAKAESLLADGMAVLAAIDHLLAHLKAWSRPRAVGTGWRLWPARAQLRPVPLGVVGVMSPWNYPVNLALVPLATAIAAGNHVFLKPSEHTPRTAAFLTELLASVFPPERVAVAGGGPEVAAAFAGLAFDHLVFTGSTAVGRKVMAAAAAHLTPLTLELGGKSPAIVCDDAPLAQVAARLATGKWFNAGQTCIAPDYVLVGAARREALVAALREQVQARYGDLSDTQDYSSILDEDRYQRLLAWLEEARGAGAQVIELTRVDPAKARARRLIAPTVVLDAGDGLSLMREEIFGPVLPIVGCAGLDEAIAYVQARPRPLALYPFGRDRAQLERILGRLVAGGVTVNDTLLHFAAEGLPFGGIGASGMGAYHGQAGFDAMSKLMPVLWQPRWAASDLLRPPYARLGRLLEFLVR
jgi:coniferyl-aldehyde dehydrogenase